MRNNNSYQLSRLPTSDQSSLNARRWKGLLGVLLGASMFAAPLVRCEQEETADGNKTQETENSQEQKTKGTAPQDEPAREEQQSEGQKQQTTQQAGEQPGQEENPTKNNQLEGNPPPKIAPTSDDLAGAASAQDAAGENSTEKTGTDAAPDQPAPDQPAPDPDPDPEATQNEGALQKSSDAKGGSLLFALIGLVAILGVGAGALLTLLLKLKARTKELEEAHAKELGKAHAKERETKAQQEKILSGEDPVHLVTEEARKFLTEFFHAISSNTAKVHESIKHHQEQTGTFIEQSSQGAKEAQRLTEENVKDFRDKLNGMLEQIQKYMGTVVEDTRATRSEAAETKELTRNVADVLQAKEQQITELQQGYQRSLLGPLTTEFLSLRDSLVDIRETTADRDLAAELGTIDQRLVAALEQIGITETSIPEDKPERLAPHLWEPISATSPTDDPGKDGTVHKIHRRGYHYHSPSDPETVLRKAVVVLYAHSENTGSSPQPPAPTPSNEAAPDKTNS